MIDHRASAPHGESATIRRATRDDASAIEALIALYVPSGTLLPRSRLFIAEHAPDFIVAIEHGRVAGCVHLEEYAPSLAEIRSLVVDPENQGVGIGAGLVMAAEQLARRREIHTVFAVSNNGAFFVRQGFAARDIPELDRERSEVSKFKGVYAKDV